MSLTENTHIILGTAGHIDHGKSTLVKALTGVDPDRLAEEKKRGITIQLGFAELSLDEHTTIGIVDVPGHEKFVRQMIAGSTGIDVALLCIAADDGIMPQTKEHLSVLELLHIEHLIVAITKCDTVDSEWVEFITSEIASYLADTPYAGAPLCPVSSMTGEGLDVLKAEILAMTKKVSQASPSDLVQLPVDRVFNIKGSGTVITGTLWNGTIKLNDELEILPQGTLARVRSIQNHGKSVDEVGKNTRVALNLTTTKNALLKPGDFIATPGSIIPTDHFDCWLTYLGKDEHAKPLKSGTRVHIAHGTKEIIGRVLFMNDCEGITPRNSAYAQIRLEEPLPLSRYDHIIIRSYSPVYVVGGGTVLLTHPKRRTHVEGNAQHILDKLKNHEVKDAIKLYVLSQKQPCTATKIGYYFSLPTYKAFEFLATLTQERSLSMMSESIAAADLPTIAFTADMSESALAGTYFTDQAFSSKRISKIENELLKFHAANPQLAGINKTELWHKYFMDMDERCFDILIQNAAETGKIVLLGGLLSHPKATAGIKANEENAKTTLIEIMREEGITPSAPAAIMEKSGLDITMAKRMMGALIKEGLVVDVTKDLYYLSETLEQLINTCRTYFIEHEQATAAELKDAMGLTRKYTMPLLEYMDAEGITVRDGDFRSLRTK